MNVHIYNLGIKPFREIKSNSIAKLLNRDKTRQRISKKWIIIHPDGQEEHIFNLRKFCRENNLDNKSLINIADGAGFTHKGFSCRRGDGNIKKTKQSREHLRGIGSLASKKYLIEFPDGQQKEIIGLREFCRQNNLYSSGLRSTLKHNRTHHGYRILQKYE